MPKNKEPESVRYKGAAKWLQYLVARTLISLLQSLPVSIAFRMGRIVGLIAWKCMPARRKVVYANLSIVNAWLETQAGGKTLQRSANRALSSSGKGPLSLDAQVKEVFQRSGANLFSGFTFSRMSVEQSAKHIHITGIEHLRTALSDGKGAIILLAHMGPWEALAQLPEMAVESGIRASFGALYRPLNNHYLDEWYRAQRQKKGTRLFSRRDGFHKPVDFLRGGGMLGVLADQKIGRGERVPFFGRTAKSNPLPGILQRRSAASMLSVSLVTVGACQWELSIRPLCFPDDASLRNRTLDTKLTNEALEQALSLSPLDGFWFHQRYSKGLS